MSEIEVECRLVAYRYTCDECGSEMKATGEMLTSYPPQWPHGCENGHTVNLRQRYPSSGTWIAPLAPASGATPPREEQGP